ncbi:MAG TPA: dihydrofolate reductase family protein [Solirubrobacterales bacterium]|nr:dihydrofolate reductase family protein [Solirubrobacterales bacterium]
MARVIVTEFVTLDGVFEDPGGAEDFDRGGWAFQFERGEDGDKFKLDETMDSEALLLGRHTFEGFAQHWPAREGEFADKFNNSTKYVVSSTMTDPESVWSNSQVVSLDDVAGLRDGDGGDIVVHGSGTLVRALLERGLVDELRLMVFPVILGAGKRLFADGAPELGFGLVEARRMASVTILTLRPSA